MKRERAPGEYGDSRPRSFRTDSHGRARLLQPWSSCHQVTATSSARRARTTLDVFHWHSLKNPDLAVRCLAQSASATAVAAERQGARS